VPSLHACRSTLEDPHADVAVATRDLSLAHAFADPQALGRGDFEQEAIRHAGSGLLLQALGVLEHFLDGALHGVPSSNS
jgi:hypothetical protein